MIYIKIENNLVVDAIVCEENDVRPEGVWIPSPTACIGWAYVDGQLIPPTDYAIDDVSEQFADLPTPVANISEDNPTPETT